MMGQFPFRARLRDMVAEIDPLETLFLIVFAISGLAQAATGARPGSIDSLLPGPLRVTWLLILTLGAIAALAGIFWPGKKSDALILESIGLAWVGVAVIIYGLAIGVAAIFIAQIPSNATIAAPTTIMLGIAFYWKHRRMQRIIERLKRI